MEITKVLPLEDLGKPEAFEGWDVGNDSYMELRCRVGLILDGAGEPLRPGMYLDGAVVHTATLKGAKEQEYGGWGAPDLYYLPVSHKGTFPPSLVRIGHADPLVSPYDWYADKGLLQKLSPRVLLTNLVYTVIWDQGFAPDYWKQGYAPWFRGDTFTLTGSGVSNFRCSAHYEGMSGERFVVGGVNEYSLSGVGGCKLQLYSPLTPLAVPRNSPFFAVERQRAVAYLLSGVVQNGKAPLPAQYTRGALWGGLDGVAPSWWGDYCLTVTGLLPCATLDPPSYYRGNTSDSFDVPLRGIDLRGDALREIVPRKGAV